MVRRASLHLSVPVDVGVEKNSVQPGAEIAVRPEGVKAPVGLHEGVLHEVLGVGVTSGQPPSPTMECADQWRHLTVEPSATLNVDFSVRHRALLEVAWLTNC